MLVRCLRVRQYGCGSSLAGCPCRRLGVGVAYGVPGWVVAGSMWPCSFPSTGIRPCPSILFPFFYLTAPRPLLRADRRLRVLVAMGLVRLFHLSLPSFGLSFPVRLPLVTSAAQQRRRSFPLLSPVSAPLLPVCSSSIMVPACSSASLLPMYSGGVVITPCSSAPCPQATRVTHSFAQATTQGEKGHLKGSSTSTRADLLAKES